MVKKIFWFSFLLSVIMGAVFLFRYELFQQKKATSYAFGEETLPISSQKGEIFPLAEESIKIQEEPSYLENDGLKETLKAITRAMLLAKKEAGSCERAMLEYLPDNSLMDLTDSFYKDFDGVFSTLSLLVSAVYPRPRAKEAFVIITEALESGVPLDPIRTYKSLEALDTCRPLRVSTFIDTTVESSLEKGWEEHQKQKLLLVLFNVFIDQLENHHTIVNIGFSLNMISLFQGAGFVSKDFEDEIEMMFERIGESDNDFQGRFSLTTDQSAKRSMLRDHLVGNREIAFELQDLMKRIMQYSHSSSIQR